MMHTALRCELILRKGRVSLQKVPGWNKDRAPHVSITLSLTNVSMKTLVITGK